MEMPVDDDGLTLCWRKELRHYSAERVVCRQAAGSTLFRRDAAL
jgi:hypothetical protein